MLLLLIVVLHTDANPSSSGAYQSSACETSAMSIAHSNASNWRTPGSCCLKRRWQMVNKQRQLGPPSSSVNLPHHWGTSQNKFFVKMLIVMNLDCFHHSQANYCIAYPQKICSRKRKTNTTSVLWGETWAGRMYLYHFRVEAHHRSALCPWSNQAPRVSSIYQQFLWLFYWQYK